MRDYHDFFRRFTGSGEQSYKAEVYTEWLKEVSKTLWMTLFTLGLFIVSSLERQRKLTQSVIK